MGVVSAAFVFVAWKFGKQRLYSAIVVFLILITSFGGKIVEFFGHETNTGNIFYASVFLATYFMIERYGKREGIRSIWIGVIFVFFFAVLTQLAIAFVGSPSTAALNNALSTAFSGSLRLAFASLFAYIFSQSFNVYLYIQLKERFAHWQVWVRANVANAAAQIVDSIAFFIIAFWGVVAPSNVWDVLITGYVVKVVYMMLASPLLYVNNVEEEVEEAVFTTVKFK